MSISLYIILFNSATLIIIKISEMFNNLFKKLMLVMLLKLSEVNDWNMLVNEDNLTNHIFLIRV